MTLRSRLPAGAIALAGLLCLGAVAGVAPAGWPSVAAYAGAHGTGVGDSGVDGAPAPAQRARCARGDLPETDRQGRVPARDYASGRAAEGYTCNARVVAATGGTGGFQVHRYVDRAGRECAYYDSTLVFPKDAYKGEPTGTYVLDMSDPRAPRRTAVLDTPAMQTPHESLRLHAGRGLLVANAGSPSTQVGWLDVYDVSVDCRTPVLRSSSAFAGLGHEGGMSPDGLTYWAATTATAGITAFDLTDPAAPTVVWRSADWATHGVSTSPDGTRLYLADMGKPALVAYRRTLVGGGGLRILDVSDVQRRVPNPQVREIAELTWPEATIPQNQIPVTIRGRSYLVQIDEYDTNVFEYRPDEEVGAGRIIDISDERRPRVVSHLRLEVHDKAARGTDQRDDPGAQRVGQGYAGHYCALPREVDPGIVACSMIASGLRVFDIRNPLRPREVAYHIAPQVSGPDPSERGAYAMAAPAFVPERREIWYSDANTGFYVLRLPPKAWPRPT